MPHFRQRLIKYLTRPAEKGSHSIDHLALAPIGYGNGALFGLRDSDILAAEKALISAHLDSLDAAMADGSFDSIFNQGSTCKKCTSLFPQSTVSRLRYWIIRRIQRFSDPNPEIWLSFYEVSQSARKGCAICRLVLGYHMLYRGEKRPFDDYGLSLHCWVSFLRIRSGSQLLSLTHDFQNSRDTRPGPDEPCTLGTDSPQCLALAKSWLDSCFDSHSKCKMGRDAEGWLPTRLIDIRRKATPRLVITSDLLDVRNTTYATLSHRWSTSPVLRLTTANIEAFKRSIPVGSLSDVFREAIKFVNSLGIPYIWIDSLCIVQDEISDWEQESALMGDVYRNGVVNIAATGNADFGGGLFQRRDPQWVTPSRICLRHKSRTMNYAVMPLRKVWHHWVTASALNKRGWVLQERLLSPRTIHMGKQLFWECREGRACETHPKPIRYISTKPDFFISNLDMGNSLKDLSRAADTPSFWFDLIKEYGACNITKQEDKLYALVGVAKFLQPILNDVYLAGLWQKDLPYNLTWRIEGEEKRGRPDAYRCPTWSWASLDFSNATLYCYGSVFQEPIPLVTTLQAHVEPRGGDAFGSFQGGYLRLRGKIGLFKHGEPTAWAHTYWDIEDEIEPGSSEFKEDIHMLPISVCQTPKVIRYCSMEIRCLLLQKSSDNSHDYIRVGLFVIRDQEVEAYKEQRWVFDYARAIETDPDSVGPDVITIY